MIAVWFVCRSTAAHRSVGLCDDCEEEKHAEESVVDDVLLLSLQRNDVISSK